MICIRLLRDRLAARLRRRGSRGAVAVEAALITPLLVLLVFGIIEFGMLFKNYLAVTSSVRAGVRIASAEPRQATFAQDAANAVLREGSALDNNRINEIWVYKANPTTGMPLSGNFTSCTSCVQFTVSKQGTGWVATPKSSPTWPHTSQNACAGTSDSLGVYISYQNAAVTGLIFNSITLSDHAMMRLEPMAGSNATNPCKP